MEPQVRFSFVCTDREEAVDVDTTNLATLLNGKDLEALKESGELQ